MAGMILATPALAGPPFLSDDPDPTPYQHYEILIFGSGARTSGDLAGDAGLDFNYGGGANLQLTATVPASFERPRAGLSSTHLGDIELAAKYRFLDQGDDGWSAAIFPHLNVPAGPGSGDRTVSLLIPVWVGRHADDWSFFGGGGCAINNGEGARNYCLTGWGATRDIADNLHLGAEIFHQGADTVGGYALTVLGIGGTFDINDNVHLLGWWGRGVEHPDQTGRDAGYASILFTF